MMFVEEEAVTDELTGLTSRASFEKIVTDEIKRHSRYGGIFSLMVLCLDSFEAVGDKSGHPSGDKLLLEISTFLKNSIRSADRVLRYGEYEFAVILPNTSIDAAKLAAERIQKQVSSNVISGCIPVTTSVCLASWPIDGLVAGEVIAVADKALNYAKRSGSRRVLCASEISPPLGPMMAGSMDSKDDDTLNAVYALAAIVDARTDYYSNHWRKVKAYTTSLAEALNLEQTNIARLETCALLHDIGKIIISDKIINKRSRLTSDEWKVIKTHPQVGVDIIGHARKLTPCIPGILYHHERYDGNGYPERLRGENIPLDARLLSIADVFAAMTSDRPYSSALPLDVVCAEIKQGAGSHFDPNLVEAFLSIV